MIARLWHGWTSRENADAYEALLKREILPGIHRVAGYRGAHLLRRDGAGEVEFVTVTWFESMDAVRAFAGEDWEAAVVPQEARRLLSRFDARSVHYQALAAPDGEPGSPGR
jgi:heme-degrading monooxygenase HmoA